MTTQSHSHRANKGNRLLFACYHFYLDPSNGASITAREMLLALAGRGCSCQRGQTPAANNPAQHAWGCCFFRNLTIAALGHLLTRRALMHYSPKIIFASARGSTLFPSL